VVKCKTQTDLFLIQGTASKLHPTEEIRVVRSVVAPDDWRKVSALGGPAG
jgi:hypothetical protein